MALSESGTLSVALRSTLEFLGDLRDIDKAMLEQLVALNVFPGGADIDQLLAGFGADQDAVAADRFAVGDKVGVEIGRRVSQGPRCGGRGVGCIVGSTTERARRRSKNLIFGRELRQLPSQTLVVGQ